MVAAKSSRVNRQYKKKYRIRNWREYERGLRSRDDVTIWLSEDAIAAWVPLKNGLRGGQRRYSNLAVRTAGKDVKRELADGCCRVDGFLEGP